jgi:hypothetical protein
MNKRKVGLVLFWIGVIWGFAWGILGSFYGASYRNGMTFEELEQSIWATTSILSFLWGFGPPLAALVAGVGLLLRTGTKGSTVWKLGIGVFIAMIFTTASGQMGHHYPLYPIAATLILLFFFGVLWFWAKERAALQGQSAAAADLKLVGYVFMLLGVWFTCSVVGWYYARAFAGQPPMADPIIVMIYFALGWLFLLLGHYRSRQQQGSEGA